MVFQILRKSPGVSAICAGRAFLSIVRVCLAADPNPKRRLGGKISQLVPSAEGGIKAHSQTAGLSRSRRPRTVQVRGFFKPLRSTY